MDRKSFLRALSVLPLAGCAMKLKDLNTMTEMFPETTPMPVLFLGHGSPMNAIESNEFSLGWQAMGAKLPKPNAVLVVSAHWETRGTYVTAMEKPRTIHDFGGFPQALFDVQYPAPGSPAMANLVKETIIKAETGLDLSWGLDHGAWSVVKHLFPQADVPVLQLSLDFEKDTRWHYELAKELQVLRKRGVLIVGSGNMVHNLGMMNWHSPSTGFDWAQTANTKMKEWILAGNFEPLFTYKLQGSEWNYAIPTPEHFLPLLYTLGLKSESDQVEVFNDKCVYGSISMTSLKIG